MGNGSTGTQDTPTLDSDGGKNRESQETGGADAFREDAGFCPSDVASRVFGPDPARSVRFQKRERIVSRTEWTKDERAAIAAVGFLPRLPYPKSNAIEARGTEHVVRFRGKRVEKHQHANGWAPVVTPKGRLGLEHASPAEYLRRLELQNTLFGDDIRIIGLTRADRFAISQPTLRGGEPSENEIRDVLEGGGWKRVPINLQDLAPTTYGIRLVASGGGGCPHRRA